MKKKYLRAAAPLFYGCLIIVWVGQLIISCASTDSSEYVSRAGLTAWMNSAREKYPQNKYLSVIGEGDTLKQAKENGAASMANIFKADIKSSTTSNRRYEELMKSGQSTGYREEVAVSQNITVSSDLRLVNLIFAESVVDESGRYYVVAFLDRTQTGALYQKRIRDGRKTAQNLISKGQQASSSLIRFGYYDAALVIVKANQELLSQLEIINSGMAAMLGFSPEIEEIAEKRAQAGYDVVFAIVVEGDQSGRISDSLKAAIQKMGFSADSGGAYRIQGRYSYEKVELNNRYKNAQFRISLSLHDQAGKSIVGLEEGKRISATSESALSEKTYAETEKIINHQFIKELVDYLDSRTR